MRRHKISRVVVVVTAIVCLLGSSSASYALVNPQSGSLGLEATIPSSPPTTAATIAVPSSGQSFSTIPITIGGLCPSNLLIKIFDNNVFTGSTVCVNGSYSLKVDLFNASNSIYAQDFDALGQGGPLSNTVNITFNSGQFSTPGAQVIVTSAYAEQGADPGQQLVWPITLGGGTGPYAISTTWGDGLSPTLQSSSTGGVVDISHTFNTAGIYFVDITVTDNNGSTGFLQVVAVANGQLSSAKANTTSQSNKSTSSTIPWWVFLIIVAALWPTFWLGSRHGRSVLSRKFD